MPRINVNLDGEGAWPDMEQLRKDGKLIIIPDEAAIDIAVLDDGTVSGEPSVAFRFHLPDGKVAFAQTTLRLYLLTANIIQAKYPDL